MKGTLVQASKFQQPEYEETNTRPKVRDAESQESMRLFP